MPETLELLEGGGGGTELLELLLGTELELGATDELLGEDTTAELLLTATLDEESVAELEFGTMDELLDEETSAELLLAATLDEETSAELLIAATFELLERAELPGAMLEELGSSPPPPPPDEQDRVNVMARPKPAASERKRLVFIMNSYG